MATPVPLQGCRVIVTRPEEQAEALASLLRERGAEVRVRPLVRIAPPADAGRALRGALARATDYDWVVFTSANAVRAWAAAGGAQGRAQVACVGEATARSAREHGLEVATIPAVYTGAALAETMRAAGDVAGARVLWPRASGAGDAVRAGLTAAGASVDAVDAYTTVEDDAAAEALCAELQGHPCDVITFTSPSGVRSYARARRGECRAAVAVIGTVTRAAAVAAGLTVDVLPQRHTMDGLVEALERWYQEGRGTTSPKTEEGLP